ncbi:hypothetical protein SNEBB_009519 [Seison nebaliae]|nr:hypothetical protein SNEBB_009519 [Seison nebaliae]
MLSDDFGGLPSNENEMKDKIVENEEVKYYKDRCNKFNEKLSNVDALAVNYYRECQTLHNRLYLSYQANMTLKNDIIKLQVENTKIKENAQTIEDGYKNQVNLITECLADINEKYAQSQRELHELKNPRQVKQKRNSFIRQIMSFLNRFKALQQISKRSIAFSKKSNSGQKLQINGIDQMPQPPKGGFNMEHISSMKVWRNVSIFLALPLIIVAYINAFYGKEHEERPPFVPYEHLRIRTKAFPWGDGNKTLLHDPHVTALPEGYEDEQ